VFIPALPEAIENFQNKYKIIEGYDSDFDNKLSDVISSLYSTFYNMTALIGPIIGAVLYQLLGYARALDINMFTMWAFAVLFMLFNCGFSPKKEEREMTESIGKLKELGVMY